MSAPEGGAPSMPKKKDPRLRALQSGGGASGASGADSRKFFDSVEYEVQRQQQQHNPQAKADMRTAARSQPHAGLPGDGASRRAASNNPFRMPTDEEVFVLRDEERRQRAQGRDRGPTQSSYVSPVSMRTEPKPEPVQSGVRLPALDTREVENMTTFIQKKREMGLARMSLATKRQEIKKLEEDADRAEKRLRQQQEQLQNTHSKFNDFLRQSNMEQDAAVKRADIETKAKQDKMQEVKKLNGLILLLEIEKKKNDEQMDQCVDYKGFLDRLTPPVWFRETLTALLIEDERAAIAAELERRLLDEANEADDGGDREEQLLHELNVRVAGATTEITAAVEQMEADEVRMRLDAFDAVRVPMYFTNPQQILTKFYDIEEANLFLIQKCQELEEEIEAISQAYQQEQTDMVHIAQQRKGQMEGVQNKIAVEQGKLKQLTERLERARDVGAGLTQEQLRAHIEERVTAIFRTIGGMGDVSNMDTLGMLTIVEARLEEMHRTITDQKGGGIDEAFVAAMMKARDKERRHQLRLLKQARTAEERERRSRIALERSQAPFMKRVGKPVMWRSRPLDVKRKAAVALVDENAERDDEFFA